MALPRTKKFPKQDLKLAEIAKALTHPARLAILMTLAEKRECICGELVLDLPLAQSTVSQHLKALCELDLIKGTIDGPRSRYCINWQTFDQLEGHLQLWFQKMARLRQDNNC